MCIDDSLSRDSMVCAPKICDNVIENVSDHVKKGTHESTLKYAKDSDWKILSFESENSATSSKSEYHPIDERDDNSINTSCGVKQESKNNDTSCEDVKFAFSEFGDSNIRSDNSKSFLGLGRDNFRDLCDIQDRLLDKYADLFIEKDTPIASSADFVLDFRDREFDPESRTIIDVKSSTDVSMDIVKTLLNFSRSCNSESNYSPNCTSTYFNFDNAGQYEYSCLRSQCQDFNSNVWECSCEIDAHLYPCFYMNKLSGENQGVDVCLKCRERQRRHQLICPDSIFLDRECAAFSKTRNRDKYNFVEGMTSRFKCSTFSSLSRFSLSTTKKDSESSTSEGTILSKNFLCSTDSRAHTFGFDKIRHNRKDSVDKRKECEFSSLSTFHGLDTKAAMDHALKESQIKRLQLNMRQYRRHHGISKSEWKYYVTSNIHNTKFISKMSRKLPLQEDQIVQMVLELNAGYPVSIPCNDIFYGTIPKGNSADPWGRVLKFWIKTV